MSVDKDLVSVQQARDLVEAAHRAQVELAKFDQAKIDRICAAMARAALKEALRLGTLAVEETGYGIAEDKAEKNRFASEDVWNYFSRLKTVGLIAESKEVMEIASPRGVIAGIIPSTNPTSTAIFKCLIAVKSRNAIVLSPHPSAARCINETARIVRDAAIKEGLPPDAIGCMSTATIEGTEALMKHKATAVILATGGIGLVRAAYSSGKPAFGVGPGNVPVFVERTADVAKAVQDILTGKCFDNGTICASEQAVVVDAPVAKEVRAQFESQGGHFVNPREADELAKVVSTSGRTLNPKIVGKSVDVIAGMAGITIPPGTRCLMVETGGVGREYPLSMEKLSPILAFYVAEGMEAGAARCFEVLSYGGMGHTAGIHTRSRDMARAFGTEMPASRVVVNTPTTHGAIGFSTALPPSMTLGCGSWGGNVTSDNISPIHLMDIKRVAFETRPVLAADRGAAKMSPARAGLPQMQTAGGIKRNQIEAIVDRFLSERGLEPETGAGAPMQLAKGPSPVQPIIDVESSRQAILSEAAPHAEAAPSAGSGSGNGSAQAVSGKPDTAPSFLGDAAANGHKPVDFVSEDDVRRALSRKEKIYINAHTIITPAARDAGEPSEVFAKV